MEVSKSLPDRSDQMVNNRYNKLKEWHSENQWLQHQPVSYNIAPGCIKHLNPCAAGG